MGCSMRIQNTCLNPRLSLRRQMFLSFGITAVIAIAAFVLIGLYTTYNSGQSVRREATKVLEDFIKYSLGRTAQYVAETMAKKFDNIGGAGALIGEATRDRFVGYSSLEGWKTDDYVPFIDILTNLSIYPIDADPMPLEWNITGNVNADNAAEHLSNRPFESLHSDTISTAHAAYFMRGMCDPNQKDPQHPTYYPGCTKANNDLITGGVIVPTDTNYYIATKAKDLIWMLKPLYESHEDFKFIGIFFANDGAGSTVSYPATTRNGRATYTSIGCDWMKQIHPRSGKPIGTSEQIQRCHKEGETISMRDYNPLERAWCRDHVLRDIDFAEGRKTRHANNMVSAGPYKDPLENEISWILTFGNAVFDAITDDFIACTLVDVSVKQLYNILKITSARIGNTTQSALIRSDVNGTVVVATQWDPSKEETMATVVDERLDLGIDGETYDKMLNLVDYNELWSPESVAETYHDEVLENDGKLIMVHPIPTVPEKYDPHYRPEYFIVVSMEKNEAFGVLDEMDLLIDEDVKNSINEVLILGGAGFGVIILSIAFISSTLTKPLRWMQKVSGIIVDNAGGNDLGKGLTEALDSSDAHPCCSPRTEVTLLLSEFVKMMNEFSGDGAAEVAGAQINEVKNNFRHMWRPMFDTLYPWAGAQEEESSLKEGGIPKQLSIHKTPDHDTFDDELTADSTMHTERTFLSMLPSSITNSQYSSTIELALSRTTSVLQTVKEYAVSAAIKAGVMPEPEEEKYEGPPLVNLGPNIHHPPDPLRDYFENVDSAQTSYLFWWTAFLVGTPIVVSAIMISVVVATDANENIPTWLADVKQRSVDIELAALITATGSRAYFGYEVMNRFTRDLHIYTRVAGWLLFGALKRADSFTFQTTGSEQCKDHTDIEATCPFALDDALTPCPCEWDDSWGYQCKVFNATYLRTLQHRWYDEVPESNQTYLRALQHRWFEGLASDADENGNRFNTSYPLVDYFPNATNWWGQNISELPGAYKGSEASSYETTYDRLRVLSALSVADFPLYNYYPGKDEERYLGTYIGLEADGMFTGFSGCETSEAFPFWVSSEENGGFEIRGDLCPLGKYGFDARCRSWYADSLKRNGHVLITPPYLFAATDIIGMSIGKSLIDPNTKEDVGVTLIDFSPSVFIDAVGSNRTSIGRSRAGFPVVITPQPDVVGSDTLVGPNYTLGGPVSRIGDLVLPYDGVNSSARLNFELNVAGRMRQGDFHYTKFTRSTEDGKEQEFYMTFAPVNVRSLVGVNHSDFAAGTFVNDTHIYSLAFAVPLDELVFAFRKLEDRVHSDIDTVTYISLALIIAAVLLVMYMTKTLTLRLSQPIIVLVGIVKSISNKALQDELPKLEGGSCEIYDVYESLEKLCKIVRFSNASFFKGDRTKSYKIMEEALELFMNMGNQKALGVANNNLGTMVLQEQMERSSATAKSDEVYFAGMKYFEEAIRIGTFEYQNADFDDSRGDYVKQLANRYFNRGMFYIVNRKHPMASPDLEETGVTDISRAKALDEEAYLYWRERGQLFEQARNEYFCLLRRARGMLTLIQDAEFRDIWGIEDLIARAEEMLYNPEFTTSNLFEGVNLVARKQQINDLRMQFALSKNDSHEAAKLAIKMLVEDEYIIDTVVMNCITTLNTHFGLHGNPNQLPHLCKVVKRETRRGQVDSMREAKNVIFCLDYSGSMAGERMERARDNLIWMYEEHCLDKDHVGFIRFNHCVDTKLFFNLARKGNHQEEHEKILEQALDAEGGTRLYAALNHCVNMALASDNSFDSWIIALTDGESAWDFPAKQVISRINKNNKKNGPKIHVIIIGFEVSSEVGESVRSITSITDKSLYIDARGGLDEMDNAFEQVAAVITGTAITMETF